MGFRALMLAGMGEAASAAPVQAGSPLKPLSPLSCRAKERIVILANPVETPDVAGIVKAS